MSSGTHPKFLKATPCATHPKFLRLSLKMFPAFLRRKSKKNFFLMSGGFGKCIGPVL